MADASTNLSKIQKEHLLDICNRIKNKEDVEVTEIVELEQFIRSMKYGLMFEKHEEPVDLQLRTHVPVFKEFKSIINNPNSTDCNFLLEGDNLHSLKLLEKTHKGKIDVIYRENVGLKYFYLSNEYDIFINYEDGIYEINKSQYEEFNRGKCINFNFSRANIKLYMIKKNEYYMFFFYGKYATNAKQEHLYLLDGGSLRKLDHNKEEDISYYYDNIETYTSNINRLIHRYTGAQQQISQFIKGLGGSGRIHGCIIDIDNPRGFCDYSFMHIFVNPIDGTITPYFAQDVKSRTVYKDFKSLLENNKNCKTLLANYKKIESKHPEKLLPVKYGTAIAEWGEDNSVYDEGGYLYRLSKIIKSLQYCSEKNVIRVWNENLLDTDLVQKIMISNKAEEVMDEKLVITITQE